MILEVKPPYRVPTSTRFPKIFLAGTIDMGNSFDWQSYIVEELCKIEKDVIIMNPRRSDWDSTWKQGFEEPQFYQQVNWELNALDQADIIIMNFLPDSKSPITLLELGLYAETKKLLVVCPKSFYRSGNVHIVCDRYNIPLFENIGEVIEHLKNI